MSELKFSNLEQGDQVLMLSRYVSHLHVLWLPLLVYFHFLYLRSDNNKNAN